MVVMVRARRAWCSGWLSAIETAAEGTQQTLKRFSLPGSRTQLSREPVSEESGRCA
jgi:hypothetical protein